jgi:hypothetical protein
VCPGSDVIGCGAIRTSPFRVFIRRMRQKVSCRMQAVRHIGHGSFLKKKNVCSVFFLHMQLHGENLNLVRRISQEPA